MNEVSKSTPKNVPSVEGDEHAFQIDRKSTEDDWLDYEPAVVELQGKLITKMWYGPPNFGEDPRTDSKEVLPVLVLDRSVSVRGKQAPDADFEGISVRNVRMMELVLTLPHKNMIGKNVILTGTLFHANTGHHHTDVLMSVQTIRLAAAH